MTDSSQRAVLPSAGEVLWRVPRSKESPQTASDRGGLDWRYILSGIRPFPPRTNASPLLYRHTGRGFHETNLRSKEKTARSNSTDDDSASAVPGKLVERDIAPAHRDSRWAFCEDVVSKTGYGFSPAIRLQTFAKPTLHTYRQTRCPPLGRGRLFHWPA